MLFAVSKSCSAQCHAQFLLIIVQGLPQNFVWSQQLEPRSYDIWYCLPIPDMYLVCEEINCVFLISVQLDSIDLQQKWQ